MVNKIPNRRDRAIVPAGKLVRSATVGSMVFVETTERLYVVHASWIPQLPGPIMHEVRELYGRGWHTVNELADRFGTTPGTIRACLCGDASKCRDFGGLPPVHRGSVSVV